jgi:uncharacterized membrane protein
VPGSRTDLAAALLGAATGLRSQMGLAALLVSSRPEDLPPRWRPIWVRIGSELSAAGELVTDKLPIAPNRTAPSSVVLRAGMGALTATVAVSGREVRPIRPATVAVAATVATTFGGFLARRALSRRFPALAVALAEDGVAAATGLAGVRFLARGT